MNYTYLRLYNGDDAVRLADRGIAGQNISVLQDSLVGWGVLGDLENATPLGEVAAILFVLGAPLSKVIQT